MFKNSILFSFPSKDIDKKMGENKPNKIVFNLSKREIETVQLMRSNEEAKEEIDGFVQSVNASPSAINAKRQRDL